MDKSTNIFAATISSLIGTLIGIWLFSFIQGDSCLDRGGKIIGFNRCEILDGKIEIIQPTIMVVLLCLLASVFSGFILSKLIGSITKNENET